MNTRIWIAILSIVVLGGGSVAYVLWRSADEASTQRAKVLRAAENELDELDIDREGVLEALKDVEAMLDSDVGRDNPELIGARARLQLALGRADQAWETIGTIAQTPGAAGADLWIGARTAARLHAESGDSDWGTKALGLSRLAFEASGDPAAAFLGWQIAYRTDAIEAWLELDREILSQHADSLEAETVQALRHFLSLHIAARQGVAADRQKLKERADAGAASPLGRLCSFVLDSAEASEAVDEPLLTQLQRRWGNAPAELMVVVARAEIARAEQEKEPDRLAGAVDILQEVLASTPTHVEARDLIAIAHYGLHQKPQEAAHLRWLLEHAPESDLRRERWRSHL